MGVALVVVMSPPMKVSLGGEYLVEKKGLDIIIFFPSFAITKDLPVKDSDL